LPRSGGGYNIKIERGDKEKGEQAIIITGGVIVNVRNVPNIGLLDIEADRLVIWTKGNNSQQLVNDLQKPGGQPGNDLEFYLSGHVEIREQHEKEARIIRCDECYYDVNRNVAIALTARLEIKQPTVPDPIVVTAPELLETSATTYEVQRAEIFSSKLPSDPGLKIYVSDATIEDIQTPMVSLFGRPVINPKTGQQETLKETYIKAHNVFFELENIPFFYLPYLAGDARDPLGPIQNITFGYSGIFGFQEGLTLNVYQLLGILPIENTSWRLNIDYLSYRGPGLGTSFDYSGKEIFGVPAKYNGTVQAYGIYDRNFDNIGGNRFVNDFDPPNFRGRFRWQQGIYDMPEGFSVQSQVAALSDRNYLEQYYKFEFDNDVNQATFVYLKQQQNNWAWTVLVEPRLRNWVTETEQLPRLDGYLIGQSLFECLTYNAHASASYSRLRLTSDPEQPVSPTDVENSTGRFDFMQELSYPFYLGAFKVVPFAQLDLASYTNDINDNTVGRVWGGGGLRVSIPFTRLYPDVQSDLFNLQGINHKIVASANYSWVETNEPYSNFAQLDRINDDATDQALRDIRPQIFIFNPGNAALLTSPLVDPQLYAIRRLVENRIDSLTNLEVVQLDVRQRLQTKRGFPGAEHIVDWMTLDTSVSIFPEANRDNFGHKFSFLEYAYLWNIGDRLAFESTGWVEPYDQGPYVYTVGAYFNRPDRTNFYIGYRQIEPVQSRAVTGAVTYVFSPKYAMTASTTYDFGINQSLNNSLVFTRIGTDIQVSFGFSYNALLNTVTALFEIVPNLVPPNHRLGPVAAGPGGLVH
jgi:hypothetical protein